MKKKNPPALDFIIDKLTNSIENALTGEVFDTEVIPVSPKDNKQVVKSDWVFDWQREMNSPLKKVYKLTTANNPSVIQGLISTEDRDDHIFMHLVEVQSSTEENQNFILVCRAILWHSHARFLLTAAMMITSPS